MNVSGTFGGKLELSTDIKVKSKYLNEKGVEVNFQAGIEADCYFKITANPNFDWDNKVDWKTEFSGLKVTIYYKLNFSSKKDKTKHKKLNPIILIPYYKGKVSIKI